MALWPPIRDPWWLHWNLNPDNTAYETVALPDYAM